MSERTFYVYRPNDGNTAEEGERAYVGFGGEIAALHEGEAIDRAMDYWPPGIRSWLAEGVNLLVLEIAPHGTPDNAPRITRWSVCESPPEKPHLVIDPATADRESVGVPA